MKGEGDQGTLSITDAHVDSLVSVLDLLRSGRANTRPEISNVTGLGRNVVTHRVDQLQSIGLVANGQLGVSSGGRAPRELRFRADAAQVLVALLGASHLRVGLCDLGADMLASAVENCDVTDGPEVVLTRVCRLFDQLLEARPWSAPVWGIGIGLPGPVEFATGRPVRPPIMPGWDDFDVRGFLAGRYQAPVWVDNDVNAMAVGEYRTGQGQSYPDQIFVKVGSGIGAGLISAGQLHRGAKGAAGDIGHMAVLRESDVVCRCGQTGCLEALAGGLAIARDAEGAARKGQSPRLARILKDGGNIDIAAVGRAAAYGDRVSVELLTQSAHLVGETLAGLVNFFNPSLVVVGGGVAETGDLYLAEIRQIVLRRSLPLATRSLQIIRSPRSSLSGVRGAALTVIDQLLSRAGVQARVDRLPLPGQQYPTYAG